MSARPDQPRLLQRILLILPFLALFGWGEMAAGFSGGHGQHEAAATTEAVATGLLDGEAAPFLFRKPLAPSRIKLAGAPLPPRVPPADDTSGSASTGCGLGRMRTGSDADSRAPPSAGGC